MNTPTHQFPIPFSLDVLRQDLLAIHLLQLRVTALIAPDERVFALLGKSLDEPAEGSLWSLDAEPKDYGLVYADIASTPLTRVLEQQYAFGFEGAFTTGFEPMEDETMHMWVADYLMDLSRSAFVVECANYGVFHAEAIGRCLHTSELANARLALEGREPFSYFQAPHDASTRDATAFEALTIRQMALLAGMEEMSVRTAASRKGPNQLPTYKEEGRTLVRREDAIAWLKAKNRYVPVTRRWDGPELQLDRMRFDSLQDLALALHEYIGKQTSERPDGKQARRRLEEVLVSHGYEPTNLLEPVRVLDKAAMKDMARVLGLAPELFVLRVEQAWVADRGRAVEYEIRQALEVPRREPPAVPAEPEA